MAKTDKSPGGYETVSTDLMHTVIDNIDMHDPSALDTIRAVISQPHCDAGDAYKVFWWYAPHHANLRLDEERFHDQKYMQRHGLFEEVGKRAYDGFYSSSKYLRKAICCRNGQIHESETEMLTEKIEDAFISGKINWKLAPFLRLLRKDSVTLKEHSVLITVTGHRISWPAVTNLETKLERFLDGNPAGFCDGHNFGVDKVTIVLCGPDADALFAAVEDTLRKDPLTCDAEVTLRYGPPDTDAEEKTVTLTPIANATREDRKLSQLFQSLIRALCRMLSR